MRPVTDYQASTVGAAAALFWARPALGGGAAQIGERLSRPIDFTFVWWVTCVCLTRRRGKSVISGACSEMVHGCCCSRTFIGVAVVVSGRWVSSSGSAARRGGCDGGRVGGAVLLHVAIIHQNRAVFLRTSVLVYLSVFHRAPAKVYHLQEVSWREVGRRRPQDVCRYGMLRTQKVSAFAAAGGQGRTGPDSQGTSTGGKETLSTGRDTGDVTLDLAEAAALVYEDVEDRGPEEDGEDGRDGGDRVMRTVMEVPRVMGPSCCCMDE